MPKLHLITYGCQMNEYDSERVAGLLRDERYELTETAQDADLILLNTCAIREKCEDKVFSRLGELKLLKRERPHVLIGVMGCMAQLWQGKIQERAPSVDLVLDRKSTRLNSSHLVISYAVFCLKKKTNKSPLPSL